LAKFLHHKGFYITFVNTEYNHKRLRKSRGPNSLDGLPDFCFETIRDDLPPSDADAAQDIRSLCDSIAKNCFGPFPRELGISDIGFCTTRACANLCYAQIPRLVEEGLTPATDASVITKEYLETVIDWIPGIRNIRFRDLPSDDALDGLPATLPPIYTIGPLHLLVDQIRDDHELKPIASNLWTEQTECIKWLDSKRLNSVVYVNFGSVAVMTPEQLLEIAWGLAIGKKQFLSIIRPDLVTDQQINCRFACTEWGIGMEVDNNVKRDKVEMLFRELMEGEKGAEIKAKAMEWKKNAEEASRPGGCSSQNLEKLFTNVLVSDKHINHLKMDKNKH
ncbi:hypothetical protein SCA6_006750, partial [Theobroma cacao]